MFRRLTLISACLVLGLTAEAQVSQEFLFTFMNGSTRTYVLDENWEPTVRQGQLVITPAVRVLMMDVALIRPFAPNDVHGMTLLKLLPRTPRTNNPGIQVWVEFDPTTPGAPKDNTTGLVQAAPQTWVRPEAFRMAIR